MVMGLPRSLLSAASLPGDVMSAMTERQAKKPRQKYIRCLERRAEYLEERIAASPVDLSYDKAECNAIRWAIDVLKSLYPRGESQGATPTESDASMP